MLLAVSILAVASMAFSPAALATDWDGDGCDEEWFDCSGYADWFFIDDPALLDQVCSPGLPVGIFVAGCAFSDPFEAEDEGEDFFFDPDDGDTRFGEDDHWNTWW